MVTVTYHSSMKRDSSNHLGIRTIKIKYSGGMLVKDVINILKLEEVGLITVNNRMVKEEFKLSDGDKIEFHPPFGGS